MKKRFLALLLAVCALCSMLAAPASASGSNAAVQTAVVLGGLASGQTASLEGTLTRGQLAQLLVAFSPYRESAGSQEESGTLFADVGSQDALAPYIRIAVGQGWMSGYSDGTFRPDQAVTLEEGCSAVLNLLGYDVTALSGSFPTAQLNKASQLGLLADLSCSRGENMTLEDGAVLLYNALMAENGENEVYASTLGFTVTDGQVDVSAVLLGNLEGPFVAGESTQLPFEPAAVYRNDEAAASTRLEQYDVYYYNENTRTVWIYDTRAAGRITAVSPSASAPTAVTVAGTEYTIGTASAAAQISSLNGGGVGQVVTLLLGMDDQVVRVLTGDQADAVFYGVVQSASRSLTEDNGADVQQSVAVACTAGVTRTVHVDKSLNFPAGWLVEITVDENGEQVEAIDPKQTSGTFSQDGGSLGGQVLAENVEILDTTSDGMAGTVRPERLAGVTLDSGDVRYYTTNEEGQIDRLILNNVTGDLWTYGVLDDVRNLVNAVSSDSSTEVSGSTSLLDLLPSTSEILYGIIDGSVGSTLWETLTSSPSSIASWLLGVASDNTTGLLSSILGFLGDGASYSCYIDGENTTLNTTVKYPVVAGGIAVGTNASGDVTSMTQLMPVMVDQLGAAWVKSGEDRYETADDMQVYLWYKGQYYPTTLAKVDAENYHLIGWYDSMGCAAGGKVRVLVAVKKD